MLRSPTAHSAAHNKHTSRHGGQLRQRRDTVLKTSLAEALEGPSGGKKGKRRGGGRTTQGRGVWTGRMAVVVLVQMVVAVVLLLWKLSSMQSNVPAYMSELVE